MSIIDVLNLDIKKLAELRVPVSETNGIALPVLEVIADLMAVRNALENAAKEPEGDHDADD